MKKGFALLCAVMMLLSLSACSLLEQYLQSGSSSSLRPPVSDSSETDGDSSSASRSRPSSSAEESKPESSGDVSIEEQVLVDQEDIVITAKSLGYDEYAGPVINILVENNSDVAASIRTDLSSVNGIMIHASLYCDVEAGKKANTEITFYESDLERAGITTIKDIEMIFGAIDADYDTIFVSDIVTITTTADADLEQTYNDEGEVVYEDNDIKVVIQGVADSQDDGYSHIAIYIENLSDLNVDIRFNDTSVNGFMIDSYSAFSVAAGKRAVSAIRFSDEDLEENDIETIEEIEFSLEINDHDDWSNDVAETDTLTVTFA